MGHNSQLPGFCFHPTDEELVGYYLERKVYGRSLKENIISEADPYKYDPWDLPGKSCVQGRGSKLYFFSPTKGRYSKGNRLDRATEAGYWRTTGRDKTISAHSGTRAIKKTKFFYRWHEGEKTNWQMHEYILEHDDSMPVQNSFVLCKVFQKAMSKRDEGCTSEVPCTETGLRSSLGIERDSLNTQPPTDVVNPIVDYNIYQGKTLVEDTCKLSGDLLPPDDEIQMFLMEHLCDPEDLKLNGLGEMSVYENQPLMLEKGTSSVNGKYYVEDDVGNRHIQETVIAKDKSMQLSSSLSDQQDFSREILEGDFIELNDLNTPLDLEFCSSDRNIYQ